MRSLVPVLAALLAAACSSATSSVTQSSKNLLGYGLEISSISDAIYEIDVRDHAFNDIGEARDAAMLAAARIALAKGYPAFEIIGGTGFRKRTRRFQAGPLPVILPGEPSGGLVIKLRSDVVNTDAGIYDARKTRDEVTARVASAS